MSLQKRATSALSGSVIPHTGVRLTPLHDTLTAMPLTRIEVQCYAGSRSEERPLRILSQGREHLVIRIISESIEESVGDRERTHRYKVLTDNGIMEFMRKSDGWYREFESLQPND